MRRTSRTVEQQLAHHGGRILQLEKRGGRGGATNIEIPPGGYQPGDAPPVVVGALPEPDGGIAPDGVIAASDPVYASIDIGVPRVLRRINTDYTFGQDIDTAGTGFTSVLLGPGGDLYVANTSQIRRYDTATELEVWTRSVGSNALHRLSQVTPTGDLYNILYTASGGSSVSPQVYDRDDGTTIFSANVFPTLDRQLVIAAWLPDNDIIAIGINLTDDTISVARYRPDDFGNVSTVTLLYSTQTQFGNILSGRRTVAIDSDNNVWISAPYESGGVYVGNLLKFNGSNGQFIGSVDVPSRGANGLILDFITAHGRVYVLCDDPDNLPQARLYALSESGSSIWSNNQMNDAVNYIVAQTSGHTVVYAGSNVQIPLYYFDPNGQRINALGLNTTEVDTLFGISHREGVTSR